MIAIELSCLALLATSALLRARADGARTWLALAPIVGLAAWLGEDSTIRLHHFYAYAPSWHAFLDVTPALIPTIWIMVVLSARDVAAVLAPAGWRVPVAFALVLYDASLIEPICTHVGMWRWFVPGPWDVPFIGTLGWACFGASVIFWLERLHGAWRWLAVILAPLSMHALLLIFWWGALRWLPRGDGLSQPALAALAWSAALVLAVALARSGRAGCLALGLVSARMGPALFFFALLLAHGAPALLWAYAASFAVPWLVATRWTRAPVIALASEDGP